MTLAGAALGGLMVARFGIAPILILTAFMAPATNLIFAWLAFIGPQPDGLIVAIIADNITGGLAFGCFFLISPARLIQGNILSHISRH